MSARFLFLAAFSALFIYGLVTTAFAQQTNSEPKVVPPGCLTAFMLYTTPFPKGMRITEVPKEGFAALKDVAASLTVPSPRGDKEVRAIVVHGHGAAMIFWFDAENLACYRNNTRLPSELYKILMGVLKPDTT